MGGIGGQSSSIIQALAKPWVDENGKKHPGVYDEEDEYSTLWAEPYKKSCVTGCLKVVEPAKYRNAMFEAAKLLVPQGSIKFSPKCPKFDTLVFEDGTEKKLSKAEVNSLIQMDLMKEEIISMTKIKNPNGRIVYKLPPEKQNKMHDDRNYVFVMCCWEIKNLRDNDEYGDGVALDYSVMLDSEKKKEAKRDSGWLNMANKCKGNKKPQSPFSGKSPFTR